MNVHYTRIHFEPRGRDYFMNSSRNSSQLHHQTLQSIAAHVLRHLARSQMRGRPVRLDELARAIGVRREDVRHVVTRLHHEGHVDVRRMRLTMTGLALAVAMRECKLHELRPHRGSVAAVA
jgi:DNA-binding GntR family transcriptional regulator